jgi:hypothetical protein
MGSFVGQITQFPPARKTVFLTPSKKRLSVINGRLVEMKQ